MFMEKVIANFFWEGTLSLYEIKCIESFAKNGFEVRVWSYSNLNLPDGCKLFDAAEIIDKGHLNLYSQGGNNLPSLAAFSDVFRFTLLSKNPGWWFDTDCFCLKDSQEFLNISKNRSVISGIERDYPLHIACGAIYFKNYDIAKLYYNELTDRCEKFNNNFPNWGDIGPKLFTTVTEENNLTSDILPSSAFYAIHYKEINLFFDKEKKEIAIDKTADSLICHLWNEILRKKSIDKNSMPEEGSYLNYLFTRY